jgi:hypothetical protein
MHARHEQAHATQCMRGSPMFMCSWTDSPERSSCSLVTLSPSPSCSASLQAAAAWQQTHIQRTTDTQPVALKPKVNLNPSARQFSGSTAKHPPDSTRPTRLNKNSPPSASCCLHLTTLPYPPAIGDVSLWAQVWQLGVPGQQGDEVEGARGGVRVGGQAAAAGSGPGRGHFGGMMVGAGAPEGDGAARQRNAGECRMQLHSACAAALDTTSTELWRRRAAPTW